MTGTARILIVGDLHLATGPRDPFDRDESFVAFLDAQAWRVARGVPMRLVILGDLFDFVIAPPRGGPTHAPDASEDGALWRLERIAATHRSVLEALGAFAHAGGTIDLLPGNHDIELVRPAVQRRLRELLGEPPAGRLTLHPWVVHLPGVLYAEHGHQHHDLNAFATLLEPYRDAAMNELDLPLGSHLAHLLAHAPPGPWRRRATLVRLLAQRTLTPARRADLKRYRANGLAGEAEHLGLDVATLAAIDAVTPRTTTAMLARLGRRTLGVGRHPASFLHRAASEIHRLLAAQGRDVACYAFGHSHVAERRPIAPGRALPVYLNAGTWSQMRRGPTRREHPYVEIAVGHGSPVARLLSWEGEPRRERPPGIRAGARSHRPPDADRSGTALARR